MYVNPQLANYIHCIYKVFVREHMPNLTRLWFALVVVKLWTHPFSNWDSLFGH